MLTTATCSAESASPCSRTRRSRIRSRIASLRFAYPRAAITLSNAARSGSSSEIVTRARSDMARSLPRQLDERLAEPAGDRPLLAAADDPAIDLGDRDHLGGRPGQEELVGGINVVPGHRRLDERDLRRPGQVHDQVAGHALEDAGVRRRGLEYPVLDDEYVVAGTLGHLALVVEHQGLQAAGPDGLDLGQDVVQVVERLDPRVERVRVVADQAGGHDLEPVLVQLLRVEADRVD